MAGPKSERDLFGNEIETHASGSVGPLHVRFEAPPFTVMDARMGWWKRRKEEWRKTGAKAEEGRDADCYNTNDWVAKKGMSGAKSDTSMFDPVLCELMYQWFAMPGGSILDPFAGESTKGIVAGKMGLHYTGVELRQEQVDTNYLHASAVGKGTDECKWVDPDWIVGDSKRLYRALPAGDKFDFLWTSPPYYDLEVYSPDEDDGSAKDTYEEFIEWYAAVFRQACARIRDNRFIAVKVGEIRDKKTGAFRNFVGDNIRVFMDLGLAYYNSAVLLTPLGTVPLRTTAQMNVNRKLGACHQNILIFYKGNPRDIGKHFPALDINYTRGATDGDA